MRTLAMEQRAGLAINSHDQVRKRDQPLLLDLLAQLRQGLFEFAKRLLPATQLCEVRIFLRSPVIRQILHTPSLRRGAA